MFKICQNITPKRRAIVASRVISQELGLSKNTTALELSFMLGKEKNNATWKKLSEAVYGESKTDFGKIYGETSFFADITESIMQTLKTGKFTKLPWDL